MADSLLLLWAVIPPLLLLFYYYYRVITAPPLLRLLLLFIFGAISGFVALSLEVAFETVANWVVNWQQIKYSLPGIALRQLVEIGPIEEGCKLVTVLIPTFYLQRRYQLRPSTVFLFTIAVALGFTAQENWIYLFYNTASILDRSIGTPVHAMFSAPWGYALGIKSNHNRNFLFSAWLNSVICHALVNVLSSAWRYPLPLGVLSYGLFPLLLWMFWRMEQLLRRVESKPPITLISGNTPQHRYWQRGLVLFALMLGGNAIFGLFLLSRNLSPLRFSQLFYPNVLWFILSRSLLNINFAVVAWLIYRYLRRSAQRRYF
ncbi:PrsW family glutamic-type intramembrane protease [Nostoc sp. 106C]|uniref:PrsW family glutamic-type intramembrane protease n=1 Tax=Nostoc sp. 106C TaxID=1932667 RepID=UPI000A3C1FCE|nr:PrsW family glutamic-type intramembrane protease [Nostoc sp. 106C]OUL23208.1 protease PrsW [Nostoc sp. 106C]